MRRKARIDQPLEATLDDGSTTTVLPGPCWIEELRGVARITGPGDPPPAPAEVSSAALRLLLARRQIVYISW